MKDVYSGRLLIGEVFDSNRDKDDFDEILEREINGIDYIAKVIHHNITTSASVQIGGMKYHFSYKEQTNKPFNDEYLTHLYTETIYED